MAVLILKDIKISKLEKKMDSGSEIEKAYLNDFLENRIVPPEYLNYCKAWGKAHSKWDKLVSEAIP